MLRFYVLICIAASRQAIGLRYFAQHHLANHVGLLRPHPLRPPLGRSVGKVLQAVHWPVVKSLVITGDNIDDWICLWNNQGLLDISAECHQLQSLIVGTMLESQILSHSAALPLHSFLHSCTLVDLVLDSVQLREDTDWDFVIETIDFIVLDTITTLNTDIDGTDRQKALFGKHYALLTLPTKGVQKSWNDVQLPSNSERQCPLPSTQRQHERWWLNPTSKK